MCGGMIRTVAVIEKGQDTPERIAKWRKIKAIVTCK